MIRHARGRIDWSGAALGVLGLGGIVFGLLEWPPLGAGHPVVLSALAIGTVSLVWLVRVERRAPNPMLPRALFRSRTFTLVNALTLLSQLSGDVERVGDQRQPSSGAMYLRMLSSTWAL